MRICKWGIVRVETLILNSKVANAFGYSNSEVFLPWHCVEKFSEVYQTHLRFKRYVIYMLLKFRFFCNSRNYGYTGCPKKGIDKKVLFGAAHYFNSEFSNSFGFSIL